MIDPALCWPRIGKEGFNFAALPQRQNAGNLVTIGLTDERKGKEQAYGKQAD